MRGWFDAFRDSNGPTLYDSPRTPATHDHILLALYTAFGAIFLAFLFTIPGIRRNRASTFVLITASMYVLSSIVISRYSSDWHVSSHEIKALFQRTQAKRPARLVVQIGLESFNVTLQAIVPQNESDVELHFNEKYTFHRVDEVKNSFIASLERGLPYPILTMAETLSLDDGAFSWGRRYREAGYYTGVLLWSALASWALMNILFCLVPRFSGYFMLITSALLFSCVGIYSQLIPASPPPVRFEDVQLKFAYGWCFWMVLVAGFISLCFGVGTIVADLFFPQVFLDAAWKEQNLLYLNAAAALQRPKTQTKSTIQVYDLSSETKEDYKPRRASNWSSHITFSHLELTEIEQIDRVSDLPVDRKEVRSVGRINPAFVDDGHQHHRSPVEIIEPNVHENKAFEDEDASSSVGSTSGHPVLWDVNVTYKEELVLKADIAEETRL